MQHLTACAACKAFVADMENARKWMAFKGHEAPDAGFENRCAAKIQIRLREPIIQPAHESGVSFWNTGLLFRAAAAAALVVLVGFHVRSARVATLATSIPAPAPAPVIVPPQPLLAPRAPVPVMMLAQSNSGPGAVQYGPMPSRPVNWER
ncbi:MAG: hypothetical protein KA248_10410 [Kiritimatiellae bacterium]|nr:hypothetical protein [Kiritimatiellia bacterium]